MSDIDIYAGLGGGKKRVRRDDGKIFDSIAAASMSAYGYAGSGSTLVPWYTDTRQENRALLNEIGCHPL